MKSILYYSTVIMLMIMTATASTQEQPPKPEDFAGAILMSGNAGSLLRLEIPEAVYARLERADRGDIRVFDAEGLSAPFVIRGSPKLYETPAPEPLPFFAWNSSAAAPGVSDIQIDAAGAVIRVSGRVATVETGDTRQYLLDLSGLSRQPVTLSLDFKPEGGFPAGSPEQNREGNFNTAVQISMSDDLADWRRSARRQTIAFYKTGDFVQNTLNLAAAGRYVLLAFDSPVPPLAGVTASFAPEPRPGSIRESRFPGSLSEDGRSVSYTTGFYPATALNFALPGYDSLRVSIQNRLSPDDPWRTVAAGLLYRLQSSETERGNPAFPLGPAAQNASLWRLESAEDPQFIAAPDLIILWDPLELVFLARGSAPWSLAYGNAACEPPRETLPAQLLNDAQARGASAETVTPLDAVFTDEERYTARIPATPKKDRQQWILWGALAAAALIITGFALYIGKKLKSP
jgi:hypothetical protein